MGILRPSRVDIWGEPGGGHRAHERVAPVAAAGGARTVADRAAPARSRLASPLRHRVRGRDACTAGRGSLPGEHGLQPRHYQGGGRDARDGRDPVSAVPHAEPLRRARAGRLRAASGGPDDDLRALRRAWLRLPDRGALRHALAPLGQQRAHDRPADRARRRHAGLDSGAEPAERDRPHRQPGRTAAATPGTGGGLPRPRRRGLSQLERAAACVRRRTPAHRRQRTRGARRRHRSRFRRPPRGRDRARAARAAPGRRTGERRPARRAWSPTSPSEWSPEHRPRAPACSSSPTCTTRAGRRRWTAARCPSSESTTCCAACRSRPAPTRSSSATSRPASSPAGSSARSVAWRFSSPCWWAGAIGGALGSVEPAQRTRRPKRGSNRVLRPAVRRSRPDRRAIGPTSPGPPRPRSRPPPEAWPR